jgi:hypothetical protein
MISNRASRISGRLLCRISSKMASMGIGGSPQDARRRSFGHLAAKAKRHRDCTRLRDLL